MAGPVRVRKIPLSKQAEFDASLIHYAAGHAQPSHEHDRASFAVLLVGSLTETVDRRDHCAGSGQVSLKPRRIVHADRYGRHGAMLLSFVFRCDETANDITGGQAPQWRLAHPTTSLIARGLDPTAPSAALDDLLWDWLVVADGPMPSQSPPEWLRWAKSELDDCDRAVEIACLAREAGVHRVHFTRQFARHFGLPPSTYRRCQMAARALRALVDDGASAVSAAHDAGFADQSHMIRAIRATCGATPRRLAALLRH